MRDVIYMIENEYVDEVDTDSIVDKTINLILSELDPYSKYIAPRLAKDSEENLKGEFVGIGISYLRINDTVVIQRILENSPNYGAIFTGDKIISADSHPLTGDSINLVSLYLKGKENTKVNVEIIRDNQIIIKSLLRKKIINSPVKAAYMFNDTVGFINLNTFTYNSGDLVSDAIDDLKAKGMKSLILDLRGNGGGFLSEAKEIVDEFISDNKVMYYVKGREGDKEKTIASSAGDFEEGNLYVLIDEKSASASELLAGAIQDQDRGVILGRRSFGKGLIQKEIKLSDGSKIRLTTARYYTPTGRSIQKSYSKGKIGLRKYNKESYNIFHSDRMFFVDSIKVKDSIKFKTPKGKIVYGGGGIVPDVFIAIDTLTVGNWYYLQQGRVNLYDFSNKYILKNKDNLKLWSVNEFQNEFEIDKAYKEYLTIFKNVGKIEEVDEIKIKRLLKSLIAKNYYGDEAYYKVYNKSDIIINRVLELENTSNK